MVRLEDAQSPADVPAEITIPDILRSVERFLGAEEGETMGSTIVRDPATDTVLNVVSFADGRDYVDLPAILNQIFWEVMEKQRTAVGTDTFMVIWKAGSDTVEGAPPGEGHPLVVQIRAALAARTQKSPPPPVQAAAPRGPIPLGARVYVGDKRII